MEWLQHIVTWTQAHPGWTLGAIYAVSVVECLLLIGLFTPGAGVLFGLGALISLGALDMRLTLSLVTLGALTGDWISYEVGRRYGEALLRHPFLARRPGLMQKGAAFFRRHGGKGLIVAHLLGPLRPSMPAIAGVYGLSRLRFILAIVPAAALWSITYVLPGVAFGASLGLAAEVTKRLAIVILILALLLWLAFWITQTVAAALSRNAETWLNRLMHWSREHRVARIGAALADPSEPQLPALLRLAVVLLGLGASLLGICWLVGAHPLLIDLSTHEALENLRDPWGIRFAAAAVQPGNLSVYGSFVCVLALILMFKRRWEAVAHLGASVAFGLAVWLALFFLPDFAAPPDATALGVPPDLALLISIYGLVPALLSAGGNSRAPALYGVAIPVILFVVLGRFYLGGLWLSIGLVTVLISTIWIAGSDVSFRRHVREPLALASMWPAFAVLLLALVFNGHRFHSRVQASLPEMAPHALAADSWWNSDWQKPPARRVDLAGRDKQFLNVQWAGALPAITKSLLDTGWSPLPPLTLPTALRWLATTGPIAQLPLMPRMHEGHYTVLTLRRDIDEEHQYVIRLWPSGYVLDQQAPLWIGSVTIQHASQFFRLLRYPVNDNRYTAALASLQPAPPGFEMRDAWRSPASFTTRLLRPVRNHD